MCLLDRRNGIAVEWSTTKAKSLEGGVYGAVRNFKGSMEK